MKRQIRRGTFETNSSSTHAICITKEGYEKSNYIEFEFGEFGWEVETYCDTYSKSSYLITAIFSGKKEKADERLKKLKEILDDNGIRYSIPTPEIKSWEYDGKTEYYYDFDGYVDHSSETEEFVNAVLEDSDKLMRYLFGDSMIITGNDNGDSFDEIMYVQIGEEKTKYGTYPIYGELKPEFKDYEIYEKGN